MSYEFYKVFHIVSLFALFMSLGAMSFHRISGGSAQFEGKRWLLFFHGFGLIGALISGFGLLARLNIIQGGLPGWTYGKLVIWLILGGIASAILRTEGKAKALWFLVLLIGAIAAYLARYKPF